MTNGGQETALAPRAAPLDHRSASVPMRAEFTAEQIELIRRTYGHDLNDNELALFLYEARQRRLDPLMRQVYAVKRWNSAANCKAMTIQTGIDGLRLIADRTRKYAPGPEPTFKYADDGLMVSATAHVKKLTDDGTWHVVPATAMYEDYVVRDKGGKPTPFWQKPHIQLAKCAEALALRKAFPAETHGIYIREEMGRDADVAARGRLPAGTEPARVLDPETGEVVEESPVDRRTDATDAMRDMIYTMIGLPSDPAARATLSKTANAEARKRFREITGYQDYRLLDDEQFSDAHQKVAVAFGEFKFGESARANA